MYHIMLLNMNDAESERMNKNEVKEQDIKKKIAIWITWDAHYGLIVLSVFPELI